jgi:hypothetical protein
MHKQLIYLASPYSHADTRIRDGRFHAVCHAAARLMREGHLIFSPIAHCHPIAMSGQMPTSYDYWHRYNHAQCEAAAELWVLCLSGWDASAGVKGEIAYMEQLGRPVKYIEPMLEEMDLADGRTGPWATNLEDAVLQGHINGHANVARKAEGDGHHSIARYHLEHERLFRELQRRRAEDVDWKAMLARSGMDLSPCLKCGEVVICLPDGMPMCSKCADQEESIAKGAAQR